MRIAGVSSFDPDLSIGRARNRFLSLQATQGEFLGIEGSEVHSTYPRNPCFYLQDSKRFESIDLDFKELAYDAQKTPNVVEATNKPGLYEKLEDIQSR